MNIQDILSRRLANQRLSHTEFSDPAAVVAWLGAVQSQDYYAAKWALAQRLNKPSDAAIDQAFDAGRLLRTHILRPTWHFVSPPDLRWLQTLTAPRVRVLLSRYDDQFGVDANMIKRSRGVLAKALQGGRALTRAELDHALQLAGIRPGNLGRTHLLMRAELDGLITSGPRRGKQFTHMLVAERVPAALPMERDEALAELVRRYFTSHGPAQVPDFVWWSGLTAADTHRGLAALGKQLARETVDGRDYWYAPGDGRAEPPPLPRGALLLANYDEYAVAYRDRDAFFDPKHAAGLDPRNSAPFSHVILIRGRVRGFWKRTLKRDAVRLALRWLAPPSAADQRAVAAAAKRYGKFMELPVNIA